MRPIRTRKRLVGAAGLAALALAASSCGISLQQLPKIGGVTGPTYTLHATFKNVVNLPANAEVREGAFQIGYVSNIQTKQVAWTPNRDGIQADVTLKIKKDTILPKLTTAQVAFDTPLGEDYVQMTPPPGKSTGPVLVNGDVVAQTETAPSIEDALAALGLLLNGGGINQLHTIIEQTNDALRGNQSNVRSLIEGLSQTLTTFSRNTPAFNNALDAIASLSTTLNQGSHTIDSALLSLGPAVNVLASENGDLNQLVTGLNNLSGVANGIITASSQGTMDTVQALRPLLDQLVGVQQQLGPALNSLNALAVRTPNVIPGDYLQVAINATAALPKVPSDHLPLNKVTVDPPELSQYYNQDATYLLLAAGLP